jgi:HK97 family phage portal protein
LNLNFVDKLQNLFSFEKKSAPLPGAVTSLAIPEAWAFELFGGGFSTQAGKFVTPLTAMECPAVRCAVQTIAEAIGQLPVRVYSRDGASKAAAPDHPVQPLLVDAANDWTSASDFREQLTRDALLWGNGYAFINRVGGKPSELVRLDPTAAVTVQVDRATAEPLYFIGGQPIDRHDILHIKAPSLNGYIGESPVILAREAIGLALVMERHASHLFSRGGRPSGVLSFAGKLGADTATRISQSWHAAHGGDASGKTAILEEGGSFQPLSLTSVDAQFIEMRKFAIEEIARAFRVPPHMLMEMSRATWGNSEQLGVEFVTYSLMRWIKAWEGEIALKLFNPAERKTTFAQFLLDDLLRADMAVRSASYAQLIAARVLNPNEVRSIENYAPYPGGGEFANPNTLSSPALNAKPSAGLSPTSES